MKCQSPLISYVHDTLTVCRRIQKNTLVFTFMNLKYFLVLCVQGIQVSFFDSTSPFNKTSSFLEVIVLVF